MANITTVTRPYAKAILTIAKQQNSLSQWSQMLEYLALLVRDPLGYKIISNLALLPTEKVEFICNVLADKISKEAQNLVKILAGTKRLLILPELFKLYEEMRRHIEGGVIVNLITSNSLDTEETAEVSKLFAQNISGHVDLLQSVDPVLIGGGVVQIGNRVVDGSLLGRLASLRNLLRK